VYRLGDYLSGYFQRHERNATARVCERWPRSVGCAFLSERWPRASVCARLRALRPTRLRPDVAVHVRAGDVLDWPVYRRAGWCNAPAERGCRYAMPLSFYRAVPLPAGMTAIDVFSDPRFRYEPRYGTARSAQYLAAVVGVLRNRSGVPVRTHFEGGAGAADDAIAAMARACVLVPSRGGFSELARECWQQQGHERERRC